jgi:hypothetical protein
MSSYKQKSVIFTKITSLVRPNTPSASGRSVVLNTEGELTEKGINVYIRQCFSPTLRKTRMVLTLKGKHHIENEYI